MAEPVTRTLEPYDDKPYPPGAYAPVTRFDPLGLGPGWVYLNGGRMPYDEFIRRYGSNLAAMQGGQVAVLVPPWAPPGWMKTAMTGLIAGLIAVAAAKAGDKGKVAGAVASALLSKEISDRIAEAIAHGEEVHLLPILPQMYTGG